MEEVNKVAETLGESSARSEGFACACQHSLQFVLTVRAWTRLSITIIGG